MLCILNQAPVGKPPPPKLSSKQKLKTWKFATKYVWKERFSDDKAELGRWTKQELLELGPTFVKLGQIASTRGDLYPPEFTRELESLQDNVPPFDYNLVKDGLNLDIFKHFEETPFKSASIGQVHKAVLKNGRQVVVKLKRPDIYNIMKRDTDDVKDIVNLLEKVGVDTGATSGYVLDESINYLLAETDYNKEIDNAIKFRKSFKKVKWIKVPKVYRELSNNDMIVMEYVESEKLA